MNSAHNQALSAEELQMIISAAEARYAVAVLLLVGMVTVLLGTMANAFGLRKIGFSLIFIYGVLMSIVGVGFSYIIGPTVAFFALVGFVREWITPSERPHSTADRPRGGQVGKLSAQK